MRRNQKMLSAVTVLALLLALLPVGSALAWAAENPQESSPLTVTDSAGKATPAEQSYSISYDLNGGTISGEPNPTSYTSDTESFTLRIPERNGYTFAGWTGTGLDGATVTVLILRGSTGDRHYTATWIDENAPGYVAAEGISVKAFGLAALPLGDCWKVTAVMDPENATNPGVLWTSSNPSAVVVDENGLIRAVGIGTATVTATPVAGGKQKTGKITVIEPENVTGGDHALDRASANLTVGGTLRLYANSTPNAVSVRWVSSDTSVLTVDDTVDENGLHCGLVTAVSSGSANVDAYVTPRGREGEMEAGNCHVTVSEATPQSIRLDILSPSAIEVDVSNRDYTTLSATLVVAWYDADGRLLGVAVKAVTVPPHDTVFPGFARPTGASDAASCRAFLLGSGFEPLCASKSASLQSEPSRE